MSEEQLNAFVDVVKGDPALLARLRACADINGVVAIANDSGFSFSPDNVMKMAQTKLSEKELEGCCATTGTVVSAISICISC